MHPVWILNYIIYYRNPIVPALGRKRDQRFEKFRGLSFISNQVWADEADSACQCCLMSATRFSTAWDKR